MLELFLQPETWISLFTLTMLEVVLGIDNIIFISILAGKLPLGIRNRARVQGLIIAIFGRLLLLSGIAWLTGLTASLFVLGEPGGALDISGKDMVFLFGGIFLIGKSAQEIYEKVEHEPEEHPSVQAPTGATYLNIVAQIIVIDMVFSLDSIITAIGLVENLIIIVVAIFISLGVMIAAANTVGNFIDRHPSVKVLALSFLLMIGTILVAEAFDAHIPKGYIYFSLAFSLFVEMINIRMRGKQTKRSGGDNG